MKKILFILFIVLFTSDVQGQSFVYVSQTNTNEVNHPGISIMDYSTGHKDAKKVAIAGFIGMGAGATLVVVGVGLLLGSNAVGGASNQSSSQQQSNEQWGNIGAGVAVTGAVVFVAGSVMAICGGIAAHQKHRLSLITPRKNEAGVAYNF